MADGPDKPAPAPEPAKHVWDYFTIMPGPDGARLRGNVGTTAEPAPLTKEQQRQQQEQGGLTVKPNSDRPPAAYPGPKPDQDKAVLEPIMERISPVAGLLYQSFLQNYNDRSGENKLPKAININELHPGIAQRVKEVQILGDSDAMLKNEMFGNRPLYPNAGKNPGHAYVYLYDANRRPIDILDYDLRGGTPKYAGQWIFDRKSDPTTNTDVTDISYYRNSDNTRQARPSWENGTTVDTFIGTTRYTYQNRDLKAVDLFDRLGTAVHYDPVNQQTSARDSNSGRLVQAGTGQWNKLYFFDSYVQN